MLFSTFTLGMILLGWFFLALKAFAFVDAVTRSDQAFRAAGKMNKVFWTLVLGIAAAWDMFVPGGWRGYLGIAGLIAAIAYIVDVRPAVRSYGGRGRSGSYGSW